MANDIKHQIRTFIATSFLFREGRQQIADDESLLGAGLIDSTGILELVSYLEAEFGIAVQDDEIVPENLDSVGQIAAYVVMKCAQTQPAIAV
ncbi:MAG: acyl carrier protein [Hyphomicrobium sp.]|jgi:acyl carrier protein